TGCADWSDCSKVPGCDFFRDCRERGEQADWLECVGCVNYAGQAETFLWYLSGPSATGSVCCGSSVRALEAEREVCLPMFHTLLRRLWDDDQGFLEAVEFLFFVTILIVGIILGLVNLRQAINAQFTTLANAILALNLGFTVSGVSGCCAVVSGSEALVVP